MLLLDDDDTNIPIKNPDAAEYPAQKCSTLTIYNNNNTNTRYFDSETTFDNNSNNKDHDSSIEAMYQARHPVTYQMIHPVTYEDYYNSSVLTGSTPFAATERCTNDDTFINSNNKKSEIKDDNNSSSNNICCADYEDNNDNNKDGNFISTSTPPLSDCNADNAPPRRNNMNNVMC